jgi:hypothetical protein
MGKLQLTLAGEKLALEVPTDLDAKLLASAGVSAAEIYRQLSGNCMAGTLAKALAPLVPGLAVKRHELASTIARHGATEIRRELRKIYGVALGVKPKRGRGSAPAAPPPPPPPELTVELYCDRYIAGEGRNDPEMLQFAVNNGEAIEAEFQRRNEEAMRAAGKEGGDNGKA